MKKLFTLLLLTITALTFKTNAQTGTTCNADFNFTISAGTSVSFTPVISTDTLVNHHYWIFGDASASSSSVFPVHVYPGPGTYIAKHVLYRQTANGSCVDSVSKTIVIQGTTPCNLHASYTYHRDSTYPNKVYFTNLSTPSADIQYTKWYFGDGSYSLDNNPTHIYTASGTYQVCLLVRRNANSTDCQDDTCMQIQIQVPTSTACNIHAKFSYRKDSTQPNKLYFTNLSTPTSDIHYSRWSFGDGTYSYDFNATHIYTASGTYNVCLTVKRDSSCQRDTCMQIQVQVPPPPCTLVANFVSYPDSLQPNKIHFVNLSTPLAATDSVRWTFGDGTSSLDVNPTHVYTSPGTYTVCLRVKKNNSAAGVAACVREICKTIVVYGPVCNIQANFSWRADSANPSKIYFTNLSTPASAVLYVSWTFGDGTTGNSWNPDHIYAHPGTYNVCLKISGGANCYREICKQVVVQDPINCSQIANFTFTRSTANCLEFKFIPQFKDSSWQYLWTFGDGTSSTAMSPGHSYTHVGSYNVCLTVIRNNTCAATSCKLVETGLCFSCNAVWVNYEYTRDPAMPNKVYFHALSNYQILSQTWTFTKLNSTTAPVTLVQNNPTYVFPDTGYYRVCLRAITYGGCIKEYCQVIRIGALSTGACTLQAYPNPAHSQVSVNVPLTAPEMIHVYIYNSLNILVKQKDQQGATGNNVVTVSIETLVPGPYTMRVVYGNHVCYAQFQKY